MSASPYLSIVIPAYRQARTICAEISALDKYLSTIVPSHEIILVIDGNDDHSQEVVTEQLPHLNLQIECFSDNHGKGTAIKHGFSLARGQLIAFMDSGGDLDHKDLSIMLEELKLHNADIVIGSKRHSLSKVSYPIKRRIYSLVYQMINRLLFRLRIRDTQVGMKIFRREVIQTILPRILVKRFAFDLELLVVANHAGFKRIVESPITIKHSVYNSSVGWRSVRETLWDTLAIFYRLHILRWYDRPHSRTPPSLSTGIKLTIRPKTQTIKQTQKTRPTVVQEP